MKHYIDDSGNEILWQGISTQEDDHEYYCACHPAVPLAPVSVREALNAADVRRFGGSLYQCPLCELEHERAAQRLPHAPIHQSTSPQPLTPTSRLAGVP